MCNVPGPGPSSAVSMTKPTHTPPRAALRTVGRTLARPGGRPMVIELHLLQNFAPSCLNRDDTGAPKDCEFGGVRRARISSQCLKRAIRRDAGFSELLAAHGGVRTRRLIPEVAALVTDERP